MNELPCLISNMSAYASISVNIQPPKKPLEDRFPMLSNRSVFFEVGQASTMNVFSLIYELIFQTGKLPIHLASSVL